MPTNERANNLPATALARLSKIVEDGLCVGCGLCESIAGKDVIRMDTAPSGYLRPRVVGNLRQETVDTIYEVCPGLRQDSLPDHLVENDPVIDPVWGPVRAMYSSYASDDATRVKAASGGVLTALCKYILASKRVSFILHAKTSSKDATFGSAHISHTEDDVQSATGSIYGPTAPLVDVLNLLDKGEPFAFVGKPCDISALRNYAALDPRIEKLVKYWLTPVCGGIVPPVQMDKFLAERETSRGELKSFRYRGDGCPGDTEFECNDGRSGKANMYEPYGGVDEGSWQLPFRCKICPDGPGEGADIAAGDQWVDDVPDWEFSKTDKGTNAVIIRTGAGEELFNAAVDAGYLNIEKEITPRFYDTCQHHHVVKKMFTRARWEGLAAAGSLTPRSQGLRLDEFFEKNSPETNAAQTAGAVQRSNSGREKVV